MLSVFGQRLTYHLQNMVRNAATAAIKADNAKYEEAVKTLNTLQTNAQTLEKIRQERDKRAHLNIPHMRQFAARAGITEADMDRLNVIHVSGTKGKGSTCAFCESVLRHHGYKTGFFSSPHLVEVRERFELNGIPLEQEKFASYFWDVYNKLDRTKTEHDGLMPNYFGFLTVMALHVFLQERVDVAIMEVGIGGQYDSTNLIRNPVVCGVTSLGLDHTSILGTTIDKIAWHKAGIFKPGVPAFTVPQHPDAMRVLQQRAQEIRCSLTVCPSISAYGSGVKLGIKGSVQGQNASLALQLCNTWIKRHQDRVILSGDTVDTSLLTNGVVASESVCDLQPAEIFPLTEEHRRGLEQCRWLGRNQTIREAEVTFYVDGAHTVESMQQCVEWFMSEAGEERARAKSGVYRVLIFNMTGDRETTSLLKPLLPCGFDAVLFCPNIAYEQVNSADQTNNTVTKESQLNRCIENKETWERLHRDFGQEDSSCNSSNGRGVNFTNGLSNNLSSSSVSNAVSDMMNRTSVQQEVVSHALPSVSHCINWVCKRMWISEKNEVVNGDVQDILNGVVEHVVNGGSISYNRGVNNNKDSHICDLDKQEMLNGYVDGVDGASGDKVENGTIADDVSIPRTLYGNPHVQVLITGSLHLVGGALRVLGDRQGHKTVIPVVDD